MYPSTQHPPPKSHHPFPKDRINVVGIPSVRIRNNQLDVGDSHSSSPRSYTPLKVLGDGSFGTVWLCDWHGALPPNTPLSPMQSGNSSKPEWSGKRLVAVKRMKKKWEGGWDECQKLKEIESLRAIPFHPNIIPLYDFFLLPDSKELYFVFESMEGNLYHLIKIRKGRPLAGGLVSSIFLQMVSGLDHIHASGYFHRDMKPENVLVTTTGIADYRPVSPIAPPNAPPDKDVIVIIKLADFGLARETRSKPPYTEYVSTRWYRAPEVLLLSTNYSNPVDMWALGTIMAELVNLQPLFPGADQIDQIARICEVLGDPSEDYVVGGVPIGGGPWAGGIKMAKDVGFAFRKMPPKDIRTLFSRSVPLSLIDCISRLLKYDPHARLTARQCLEHRYLLETCPNRDHHRPPASPSFFKDSKSTASATPSSRHIPLIHPPHSTKPPYPVPVKPPNQPPYSYSSPQAVPPKPSWQDIDDPMDGSTGDYAKEPVIHMQASPMAPEFPARQTDAEPNAVYAPHDSAPSQTTKSKFGGLGLGKKLRMFGGDRSHQQGLPPVQEVPGGASTSSTPSLKRTQSSSSDSRSLREPSPPRAVDIKKMNRKEAEKVHKEAERQRRELLLKMHREQARAVMQKRNQLHSKSDELEWRGRHEQRVEHEPHKPRQQPSARPVHHPVNESNHIAPPTRGRFNDPPDTDTHGWAHDERMAKIRRTETEDDQSMSSSDVHSVGGMSTLSFASVDSDPGPSRIRNRPSLFGLTRMQSSSSLRTSFDDFPPSARSSNSFSLEGQLANDFRAQASVNSTGPPSLTGSVSPPPMQILSLSPSVSPSLSPSPTWIAQQESLSSRREHAPTYITVPPHRLQPSPKPSYDINGHAHPPSPYRHPNGFGQIKPDPTDPMFRVVSYQWDDEGGLQPNLALIQLPDEEDRLSSPTTSLPPFSELDAVAGAGYDYPPLSPMSFIVPADEAHSFE